MTTKPHDKIRVLIADDHPVVRDGVRTALMEQRLIEVVGEAGTGRRAVSLAKKLRPDVVLMDVSMPVMSGAEATRRIRKSDPSVRVLAFSMHDSREYIQEIIQSGASGYVLKTTSTLELVRAIRKIRDGGTYFSRSASEVLADQYAREFQRAGARRFTILTKRELEILGLIAQGRTNKEIARVCGVSLRTIETHRGHIMTKLDLHDVASLTRFAIAKGLIHAK